MNGTGAEKNPSARSRRAFLRAGGIGVAVGAAGVGGAATMRFGDVAAARERALGATYAERSRASSLTVLWRADTDRKAMALTFDDGPGEKLTPRLLDLLREAKVRATFLLVGSRAVALPDLVRRQVRDGHELGNHSWSHADLSLLDFHDLRRDLERTDDALGDLTGRRPAVIRPPYGRVNGALLQHAAIAGQQVLLWDVRLREGDLDAAGNAAWVAENLRPGTIVLAHDEGSANRRVGIDAVPGILKAARERGYEFLTASEMAELDRAGRQGAGGL
ncbi:MAG: polysaccharide deacetylase family protein [Sporichthyaceae bacterium]